MEYYNSLVHVVFVSWLFFFFNLSTVLCLLQFWSESKIHAVILTVHSGYMIKFFCQRFKI